MGNVRVNCDTPTGNEDRRSITEAILKCGTVGGTGHVCLNRRDDRDHGRDRNDFNRSPIATVSIDTRELMNPTVKIDFTSLISFRTSSRSNDDFSLRLVFRLSKMCHDGHRIPLREWVFEKRRENDSHGGRDLLEKNGHGSSKIEETESFCFSWCDCSEFPDCCRYFVEVIDRECDEVDSAVVSNVTLTALAVGTRRHYR